jgi:hypothetical protein
MPFHVAEKENEKLLLLNKVYKCTPALPAKKK